MKNLRLFLFNKAKNGKLITKRMRPIKIPYTGPIEKVKCAHTVIVLVMNDYNITRAADELGIERATLYRSMRHWQKLGYIDWEV